MIMSPSLAMRSMLPPPMRTAKASSLSCLSGDGICPTTPSKFFPPSPCGHQFHNRKRAHFGHLVSLVIASKSLTFLHCDTPRAIQRLRHFVGGDPEQTRKVGLAFAVLAHKPPNLVDIHQAPSITVTGVIVDRCDNSPNVLPQPALANRQNLAAFAPIEAERPAPATALHPYSAATASARSSSG